MLAVVGHFTNEKLQLQTVILILIKIEGKYSSSNQSAAVLRVLDDFGIRSKLGYFIMDNIYLYDELVQHLARALNADGI